MQIDFFSIVEVTSQYGAPVQSEPDGMYTLVH